MVLFNYSTRELTAKVVYYGPGLCGKTTNLQFIHENLPEHVKGKMLSLATKTDRTLFFDFLPIDLGDIRGMSTRVQLYTVPGQVFYNETRKLVLKGADGLVFVADSQEQMLGPNLEAYRNLEENLKANGMKLAEMPHVIQFNKRDLPRLTSIEELNATINRYNAPFYESVATTGIGVQDTLKAIVKLVLLHLTRKYDPKGPTVSAERAPALASPDPTDPPSRPSAPSPKVAPSSTPLQAAALISRSATAPERAIPVSSFTLPIDLARKAVPAEEGPQPIHFAAAVSTSPASTRTAPRTVTPGRDTFQPFADEEIAELVEEVEESRNTASRGEEAAWRFDGESDGAANPEPMEWESFPDDESTVAQPAPAYPHSPPSLSDSFSMGRAETIEDGDLGTPLRDPVLGTDPTAFAFSGPSGGLPFEVDRGFDPEWQPESSSVRSEGLFPSTESSITIQGPSDLLPELELEREVGPLEHEEVLPSERRSTVGPFSEGVVIPLSDWPAVETRDSGPGDERAEGGGVLRRQEPSDGGAEVLLTEIADDHDLFEDPGLDIARLAGGQGREIVVPVELGEGRTARRFKLSIQVRLDPLD